MSIRMAQRFHPGLPVLAAAAAVALASLGVAPAVGQGPPACSNSPKSSEAVVRVHVIGSAASPKVKVTPRAVTVCKVASTAEPDWECENSAVRWCLTGASLDPKYFVKIAYKAGQQDCLGGPFYLDQGHTDVISLDVHNVPACTAPSVWHYSVELWDTKGTASPADDVKVSSIDPGVIIDDGGPP